MCGICGIVHADSDRQLDNSELIAMRDMMTHRGPDDAGVYIDGQAGLGHRRLSIVDLEGGHQPLANENNKIWIVFNGEIYNFKQLQTELLEKGHRFRTNCDTEVLVHLYEENGPDMLQKLQGMFAFAIWDSSRQRLFAARDRLGIKPFYYTLANNTLYFASEIKAILKCQGIKREINREFIPEYLVFRFVSGEDTLYKGIKSLLPGHSFIWENGTLNGFKYWEIDPHSFGATSLSKQQALEKLDHLLYRSVERRLMSDVPLGTMNSGGIDSSLVTAYASELTNEPVNTYSVGFSEAEYDESQYAQIVSDKFATNHHALICTPEEFARNLPLAIWYNDEPLNHANSVPISLICKLAKNKVTVVLTGEGADEIFGGYPRYWLLKIHDMLSPPLRGFLRTSLKCIPGHYSNKLENFLKLSTKDALLLNSSFVQPNQIEAITGEKLLCSSFHFRNSGISGVKINISSAEQALYLDLQTYLISILHRMDKMSMAARVEARVPFLDHELVEFVMTLPMSWKLNFFAGKTKSILKTLARKRLPQQIVYRKKSGFGLPLAHWLRDNKSLGSYLDLLTGKKFLERQLVEPAMVISMVKEHQVGEKDYSDILWELINLELWCEIFIDQVLTEQELSPTS